MATKCLRDNIQYAKETKKKAIMTSPIYHAKASDAAPASTKDYDPTDETYTFPKRKHSGGDSNPIIKNRKKRKLTLPSIPHQITYHQTRRQSIGSEQCMRRIINTMHSSTSNSHEKTSSNSSNSSNINSQELKSSQTSSREPLDMLVGYYDRDPSLKDSIIDSILKNHGSDTVLIDENTMVEDDSEEDTVSQHSGGSDSNRLEGPTTGTQYNSGRRLSFVGVDLESLLKQKIK